MGKIINSPSAEIINAFNLAANIVATSKSKTQSSETAFWKKNKAQKLKKRFLFPFDEIHSLFQSGTKVGIKVTDMNDPIKIKVTWIAVTPQEESAVVAANNDAFLFIVPKQEMIGTLDYVQNGENKVLNGMLKGAQDNNRSDNKFVDVVGLSVGIGYDSDANKYPHHYSLIINLVVKDIVEGGGIYDFAEFGGPDSTVTGIKIPPKN